MKKTKSPKSMEEYLSFDYQSRKDIDWKGTLPEPYSKLLEFVINPEDKKVFRERLKYLVNTVRYDENYVDCVKKELYRIEEINTDVNPEQKDSLLNETLPRWEKRLHEDRKKIQLYVTVIRDYINYSLQELGDEIWGNIYSKETHYFLPKEHYLLKNSKKEEN
tara:strand:+ start:473 stop:961 length:489 start_codon:yes stop_codon:yes gene_type:complete